MEEMSAAPIKRCILTLLEVYLREICVLVTRLFQVRPGRLLIFFRH